MRFISAILIAFAAVFMTKSANVVHTGFFFKLVGFAAIGFAGYYGFAVGEKVRNYLIPDFVITDGSVASIAKTKLFWSIGLQLIGAFMAAMIASALFFKMFGASPSDIREMKLAAQQEAQQKWREEHPEEAARQDREKVEYERQVAADKARQAAEADFSMRESRVFDQRLAFAGADTACEVAKGKNENSDEPCARAAALLKEIQKEGVCVARTDDPMNPNWVSCPAVAG